MNTTPEDAIGGIERPPPSSVFTGIDRKLGAPVASWLYQDLQGRLFYQCRYESKAAPEDGEAGGKTYRPWVWSADKQTWICRGPAQPTPVYHLELLQERNEATVYVVEGEKCAEAWQGMLAAAGHTTVVVSGWGGTGSIKNARWEALAGRRVIMWPDNDEVGRAAMAWLAGRLLSLRCKVAVVNVPRETRPEHWDVADAIQAGWGYEQIKDFIQENLQQITQAPATIVEISQARKPRQTVKAAHSSSTAPAHSHQTDAWRHWGLDCKASGIPWENTENVCRVLARLHEGENFGKIWYDEFAYRISTIGKSAARAWEDADTISLQCFLQANIGMRTVRKNIVDDAVVRHARSHTRHPVREWLQGLKWDGMDRLESMLSHGWGVHPSEYAAAVGRCFLVGAVARIMRPGEKVDNVPVFEGPERGRKTMALEALASPHWYDCPQYRIGERDFYLALRGKWIIELGEMSNTEGVSHTAIRAALSKRSDNYRGPFERQASDHARMAVFAATTNSDHWHTDPHGAGRYWPVLCGTVDVEWIVANREQLFAEAMMRLDRYERWWDVPHAAAEAQREMRREPDEWEEHIKGYLTGKEHVTISEVLAYALDITTRREQTRAMTTRCAAVLRQLHWRRISKRVAGSSTPVKVWVHSAALERAAGGEQAVAQDTPAPSHQSDLDGF